MENAIHVAHIVPDKSSYPGLNHIATKACFCEPSVLDEGDYEFIVHEPTDERVRAAWEQLRALNRRGGSF